MPVASEPAHRTNGYDRLAARSSARSGTDRHPERRFLRDATLFYTCPDKPSHHRGRMSEQPEKKTCFVIAPIGARDGQVRRRSDQVFNHVIEPVVSRLGYHADRADRMTDPGMIADQIVQRLLEDDLVVADLTGHNANVFYELALRHAIRKPVVLIIAADETIPFDVNQSRAIFFDYRDLDSVHECKQNLEAQIRSLEENPDGVFSPISQSLDLMAWRSSGNPGEQIAAELVSTIQSLQSDVARLERRVNSTRLQDRGIRDSLMSTGYLQDNPHVYASGEPAYYYPPDLVDDRTDAERTADGYRALWELIKRFVENSGSPRQSDEGEASGEDQERQ